MKAQQNKRPCPLATTGCQVNGEASANTLFGRNFEPGSARGGIGVRSALANKPRPLQSACLAPERLAGEGAAD